MNFKFILEWMNLLIVSLIYLSVPPATDRELSSPWFLDSDDSVVWGHLSG